MLFLDFLIFGNGHGLASPYFDDRFYWLSGRLYTWIGGFGTRFPASSARSAAWFSARSKVAASSSGSSA